MLVSLLILGFAALVFAVFAQSTEETGRALPIDPSSASLNTTLAEVAGVSVSSPVRPWSITGLGYHPDGESLLEMAPRGDNFSANPLTGILGGGDAPESIHYYMMDEAGRDGPRTGALDVGASVGTTVHSPVTGNVTAVRPDPTVPEAKVVVIEPADHPNLRVSVSPVRELDDDIGPGTRVEAGMSELGAVADSAEILEPQLSEYTSTPGNHVTVSVSRAR